MTRNFNYSDVWKSKLNACVCEGICGMRRFYSASAFLQLVCGCMWGWRTRTDWQSEGHRYYFPTLTYRDPLENSHRHSFCTIVLLTPHFHSLYANPFSFSSLLSFLSQNFYFWPRLPLNFWWSFYLCIQDWDYSEIPQTSGSFSVILFCFFWSWVGWAGSHSVTQDGL